MGIELLEVSAERAVGTMPVEGNTQPFGLLHGGASVVLAETLGSLRGRGARRRGSSGGRHRGQRDPPPVRPQRAGHRDGDRAAPGPDDGVLRDRRRRLGLAAAGDRAPDLHADRGPARLLSQPSAAARAAGTPRRSTGPLIARTCRRRAMRSSSPRPDPPRRPSPTSAGSAARRRWSTSVLTTRCAAAGREAQPGEEPLHAARPGQRDGEHLASPRRPPRSAPRRRAARAPGRDGVGRPGRTAPRRGRSPRR